MTDIYVVHLCGKDKKIVKRCENDEEVIQFITAVNKGSSYLSDTFELFEYNNDREDGIYVVKDGNRIKVFKLQLLTLNGYLYSSSYTIRNELNSYELIHGETGQL
jgi:hypothetical protein